MEYENIKWNCYNQRISTTQEGTSASCNFNGINAYIYANKCPDADLFGVDIDDEFQDIIHLQSTNSTDSLVYESNDLPFGQYKIEVRSVSSGNITLIFFLYQPHLIFHALSYNSRPTGRTGYEAECINPAYHQSNSTGEVIVRCTRFWLVGKKGSEYSSFKINLSANNAIKFEKRQFEFQVKPIYIFSFAL